MKIGITGTRSGMTEKQFEEVSNFLTVMFEPDAEFHHGDCVGVDIEAATLAKEIGYIIVCHPPIIDDLRGFIPYDIIHTPASYFARNRRIVNETEILMVVPYQTEPQNNGGTWYTHDYAIKCHKPVVLCYPGERV